MPPPEHIRSEYDPTWKRILDWKLDEAIALFFPRLHKEIDWTHAPVSLDGELIKLAPEHEAGSVTVDRLYKVRLHGGKEQYLFVHIEIQSQRDSGFPMRMWRYSYRLFDRFGPEVISLAILADDDLNWYPTAYHREFAGCVQHFEFPVFKVMAFKNAEQVFEETGNMAAGFGLREIVLLDLPPNFPWPVKWGTTSPAAFQHFSVCFAISAFCFPNF